jgi:cellulose synthase/poly-beta-1,6-N-acetylglucosamine synthase-like glycosyltransferase
MVNGAGDILFWGLLLLSLYSYLIYPLLLRLLLVGRGGLEKRPEVGGTELPSVSLIITAYNESSRIRDKLENTLAIEYPVEQMEVIVASDCSSDDTDDIVRAYAVRA